MPLLQRGRGGGGDGAAVAGDEGEDTERAVGEQQQQGLTTERRGGDGTSGVSGKVVHLLTKRGALQQRAARLAYLHDEAGAHGGEQ